MSDGSESHEPNACSGELERLTVIPSPHSTYVNPATGLTNVTSDTWFIAYFRQNGCPHCCEFRQYVRGSFELNGVMVTPPWMNSLTWEEDSDAAGGYYGHRSAPPDLEDRYIPGQADGHIYLGHDAPGFYDLSPGDTYRVSLEFTDFIIDSCHDNVLAGPARWNMNATGVV